MFKYLRDDVYYSDLYDLWSIKECFEVREGMGKRVRDSGEGAFDIEQWMVDFRLYFLTGERYRDRRDSLEKWKEADRKRDAKLESVREPVGVRCVKCRSGMEVIFRELYDSNCDSLRVLFFFECRDCRLKRGIFEDGEEFRSKGVKVSRADLERWDREDAQKADAARKDEELLRQYRAEFLSV